MNNIPSPIFLLSSLFLFNQASIETCLDTVCQMKEPIIRFPFHIEGRSQAKTCGYKGFKVLCSEEDQTLLNLPNWGDIKIQTINYATQELYVNDPNNCLPKQLLSLNLSGSPYDAVYYQEFTFFNCSFNLEYLIARYKPIACLSDYSNYVVFATPSKTASSVHLSSVCELVETVRVPVQSPFYDHVLSSELNDDLRLSWDSPPCGKCESRGGRCGFKFNGNSSTLELACYDDPSRQGISRGASYIIAICVGVPALLCFTALLSCICSRFGIGTRGWARAWARETVADFEPLMGLDRPTIESYPKIVIGEGRRLLPKAEDKICPICLSEYEPKETVKAIPECGHCFHAQCIDEWLPLNASCPICRTSPPKLPQMLARS